MRAGVGEGCAVSCDVAKVIIQTLQVARTGAIELPRASLEEHGSVQPEDLGHLPHELGCERLKGVD